MWSIGVTTYLLLCGDTPFNGKNRQQLFRRISCDEPTFEDDKWGGISDEGVDFVRKLLAKDPAKRLGAAQALSHRWLMKNKEVPTIAQPVRSSQVPQSHSKPQSLAPLDLGPSDRRSRGSSTSVAGSVASKARSGSTGQAKHSGGSSSSVAGSVASKALSGSTGRSHRLREAKHSSGSNSSVAGSVASKTRSGSSGPSHRLREAKHSVGSASSVAASVVSMMPSASSPKSVTPREPTNRSSNHSVSRERTHRSSASKSGENNSKSKTSESRSKSKPQDTRSISRERSRIPPPPPRDSSSIAADIMKDSSSVDVNARLLDVIKSQDAKIEQLERLVKRMLDPEGAA